MQVFQLENYLPKSNTPATSIHRWYYCLFCEHFINFVVFLVSYIKFREVKNNCKLLEYYTYTLHNNRDSSTSEKCCMVCDHNFRSFENMIFCLYAKAISSDVEYV